jgi:hypothetical protein
LSSQTEYGIIAHSRPPQADSEAFASLFALSIYMNIGKRNRSNTIFCLFSGDLSNYETIMLQSKTKANENL